MKSQERAETDGEFTPEYSGALLLLASSATQFCLLFISSLPVSRSSPAEIPGGGQSSWQGRTTSQPRGTELGCTAICPCSKLESAATGPPSLGSHPAKEKSRKTMKGHQREDGRATRHTVRKAAAPIQSCSALKLKTDC